MGNVPRGQVDNSNKNVEMKNNLDYRNQEPKPFPNDPGNVNNLVYSENPKLPEPNRPPSGRSGGTICANDLRSNMPQNFASLAAMYAENDRGGRYEYRHDGPC